jgi:hypothetical protein
MRPFSIALGLAFLLCCSKPPETTPPKPPAATSDEQYRREMEEIRKTIKGEVRIKLKKDGKNESYSWEISGKDAGEILRANDTLVRKLGSK